MKKYLFFALLLTLSISCDESDDKAFTSTNLLIGNWGNPTYSNNIITFERLNKLNKDGYSISFKKSNNFIERSSGWCGTPPLVFSNYNGRWTKRDSLISISMENGIQTEIKWLLLDVDENILTIKQKSD